MRSTFDRTGMDPIAIPEFNDDRIKYESSPPGCIIQTDCNTYYLPYISQYITVQPIAPRGFLRIGQELYNDMIVRNMAYSTVSAYLIAPLKTVIESKQNGNKITKLSALKPLKTTKTQKLQMLKAFYSYMCTKSIDFLQVLYHYKRFGWVIRIKDSTRGRKRKRQKMYESNAALYSLLKTHRLFQEFCIGYQNQQISDWLIKV